MSPFRNNRGQRPRFRPAIEALEDRTVPAGNVTASIIGGTLVITGDAANNAVKIQGNTRGTIDVLALDTDTIINNQPGMVTLVGFSGSVIINMGDGHDAVVMDSVTVRGKFIADMGNGDDMLCLTLSTIKNDADIRMGNGNDNLMFGVTRVNGTAYVNAGPGDNQVNLLGARFDRGSFFVAGTGNSSIGIHDTKFKGAPSIVNFQQNVQAALPHAVDDTSTVAKGGTVSVNVAANDIAAQGTIDKTSIVVTKQPAHGTATANGDGTVTYKNDGSAFSVDSFLYTIKNSKGAVSNQAIVAFSITGVAGPTVQVASSAGAATKTTPIPFTATFSDDVTGFVQSDITVTNGTISSFVATSAKIYTFSVTPTAQGAVVVTVPAGVAKNAAGQDNSTSSATVTFDTTNPTITINPLTTNSSTPTITGTVSEAATVTVTVNTQTFNATVTGTTWSAAITTPLPAANYSVTATATDPAGNSATVNNGSALIIDQTPPTALISSSATSPTGLTSIPITVTFTENVTGFAAADITVTNATLSNFVQSDGKTYTADLIPTANGVVTASIAAGVCTDAAGNANTAAAPFSITFDNTIPGVTITSSATSPTKLTSIPITVTFTEVVTGFDATDITVANGTLGNFNPVNGTTYTATITPTADGVVTANIAAGAAVDADNHGNSAATPFTITFDSTSPAVAITSTATSPTKLNPIPITVTFTENVNGFTAADITVNNGTLNSFIAVNGTTYTANITPTADGVVTANIVAGIATDAAGNANTAASPFLMTFDSTSPTVANTSSATSPTGSTSIPITVTFTENVTGFVAADITVTNGTLGNFNPVDGKTYTATLTPTANGVVIANIAAGVATDAAGNPNTAASGFSITFDSSIPTVAHPIANISNAATAANTTILLPGTFADANITDSSVTFKAMKGTTPLDLNVELFDKDAPLTVANFFNYLDRYASNGGTIFHRLHLQTGLNIIQGGGYAFNNATNTISGHITQDAPIRNEFSAARLDVRGTLAMAKLGGDPDSATSEFFFNLDDANGNTLNGSNNGGFVVFGKLVAAADLANIDSLAAVPIKSTGGFTELPLVDGNTLDANNIERIQQVVVNHRDDELSYSATSSNPAAVIVSLNGFQNNQLTLDYLVPGSSTITVTATDKAGHSASTTFNVTVT